MSFSTLGLALRASTRSSKSVAAASNAVASATAGANANSNGNTNTNTTTRGFHSPFAVLGSSPLAQPSTKDISFQYEKQYYEHPHEPVMTHTGYRTYVVSEPDASARHYRVPAGAYPTSSPYVNFSGVAAPELGAEEGYSSTGGELLAHGFTTRAARQNRGGVGESAAVRYRGAPGEMGAMGGGWGGQGLVDKQSTTEGTGQLADMNPPPDGSAAEAFSKAGVEGAWKLRK